MTTYIKKGHETFTSVVIIWICDANHVINDVYIYFFKGSEKCVPINWNLWKFLYHLKKRCTNSAARVFNQCIWYVRACFVHMFSFLHKKNAINNPCYDEKCLYIAVVCVILLNQLSINSRTNYICKCSWFVITHRSTPQLIPYLSAKKFKMKTNRTIVSASEITELFNLVPVQRALIFVFWSKANVF